MVLTGQQAPGAAAGPDGSAMRAAPSGAAASTTMSGAAAADGEVTSPIRGAARPATEREIAAGEAGAPEVSRGGHLILRDATLGF